MKTLVLLLVAAGVAAPLRQAQAERDPVQAERNRSPARRTAFSPPEPKPPLSLEVVEHLGVQVPAEVVLTEANGRTAPLAEHLVSGRPVILSLVYFRCAQLCHEVQSGIAKAVRRSGLRLGEDYDALTVSIDPSDTVPQAALKKERSLQALGMQDRRERWAFLVGPEASVRRLADAVGFPYVYDAASNQYAHAAVTLVLTPDGRVSRYLYGLEPSPRDLRLALVEAAGGKVGTSFDRIMLTCFKYDPASRRYGFYVSSFLKGGALLVFFGLSGMLAFLWRREFTGARRG